MKKLLFTLSLLSLFFSPISFVSADNTTVPNCDEHTSFMKVQEDYLDAVLPIYLNSELTKSNKSQIDLFTKQANNWIGKQVEGNFLGNGTTALGDKVSLELNKLNRRYSILKQIDSGFDEVYNKVADIEYTVGGLKKLILANAEYSKLFLCITETPNNNTKVYEKYKADAKVAYEKTKKLLNIEINKAKSGKIPKTYAKSMNLAIWKQKILFEAKNSEDILKKNCKYEPELEAYNCGG